ncbi:MAG: glutathione peroxidase [Sediminibacterium sp.]|nr:glutathione peroxidase [Sediminibacterium sp.]
MKTLLICFIFILLSLFLIKRKDMTWRQSFLKTVYPLVMLKGKLFPDKKQVQLNAANAKPVVSFYTLMATANNGSVVNFQDLKGKKVLLVNTASDCGYTGQYDELEKLHKQYPGQLVILGFPANDFKEQEKKDDAGIAEFCKINFGVSFPLMQKSHVVKGAEQNPVFQWLSQADKNGWCNQQPVWNFSKYLVNEEGVLVGFFAHTVSPGDRKVIEAINK